MKTLLLIDANSIIHRCFHALPPLTTSSGEAGQALYGLSSVMLKIRREEKPDYAAALFDRPEPTFRKKMYAEYKAQRPKAADELISQIIRAHELFFEFGIPTFEVPGMEADDLIATLAEKFKHELGLTIQILTGDLDTLQLVEGDKVVVRAFRTGISQTTTYDEKAVKERYGLLPEQLTDYKALVGDSSDNIKGVAGIGPKTAAAYLRKFGSLEKIVNNIDRDPDLMKRFGAHREQIKLAKELVVLKRDVELPVESLEELAIGGSEERLGAYFDRLGFQSLRKRLEGKTVPLKTPRAKKKSQGSMF